MKKGSRFLLIGITLFCCGLVIGILMGRWMNRYDVTLTVNDQPTLSTADAPKESKEERYLINVNSASADLLDTLPGVGPVIAQRIVEYRNENGPFTSKTELLNIDGIGAETVLKLYDLITLEDAQ